MWDVIIIITEMVVNYTTAFPGTSPSQTFDLSPIFKADKIIASAFGAAVTDWMLFVDTGFKIL